VPDAEFRKITVDYPIEFARVLRGNSPGAAFSFLSGSGADPTGRSRKAFARYKGEAETALLAAGFPRLHISPRIYLPCGAAQGAESQPSPVTSDLPGVWVLFPNQVIPADDLARAMVDVAVGETRETEGIIFENRDIRGTVKSA
jgi:uncharacterized protein YbjT (DUF2867 family)